MTLAALRRFAAGAAALERCASCAAPLPETHAHLLAGEHVTCACAECAAREPARRVPPRKEPLAPEAVPDAMWEALDLPIGLFWLLAPTGSRGPLAAWPSPGGVVHAPIAPEAWSRAARESPALAALAPEVEALLVHRVQGAREQWLVSIDRCFELAGAVRRTWRGLSGGPELQAALAPLREAAR